MPESPKEVVISDKITATPYRGWWIIRFPYNEEARDLVRSIHRSHWSPGDRAWLAPVQYEKTVREVMEKIGDIFGVTAPKPPEDIEADDLQFEAPAL